MIRVPICAVICIVAAGIPCARAQDADVKTVIRKAVEAHGGAKVLSKYQGSTCKYKGTMQLMGQEVAVTGTSSLQKPDKIKNVMAIDLNGKNLDITEVFDGKKLWIAVMGKTMEITDEKVVNEVKESLQTEGIADFTTFLEKPYELGVVGEVKVKGNDAIGIRISKKGQRDISLYFDKKTYRIVKAETRAYDAMSGKEVTQEKFFVSYQEVQGMSVPRCLEIYKDGKAFMDIELSDFQAVERLDNALFVKP